MYESAIKTTLFTKRLITVFKEYGEPFAHHGKHNTGDEIVKNFVRVFMDKKDTLV